MNHFLSTHQVLPQIIFMIIGGSVCFWLLIRVKKRYDKKPFINQKTDNIRTVKAIVLFMFGFLCAMILPWFLHAALSNGETYDLFVLNRNNETRVVVWQWRQYDDYWFTHDKKRLVAYDLATGEKRGKFILGRNGSNGHINWFYLWESSSIWTYDYFGLRLIDVFTPELIASEEQIFKQNPGLGSSIKTDYYSSKIFNPRTHGIKVYNNKGEYYEILPNLKAVPIKKVKNLEPYKRPEEKNYGEITNWVIDTITDIANISARMVGYPLSNNPAYFNAPELIYRYGTQAKTMDKCWIEDYTDKGYTITCVDKYGNKLNSVSLNDVLGRKSNRVDKLYAHQNHVYIFTSRDWFTLTALKFDMETGTLLGKVNYFK